MIVVYSDYFEAGQGFPHQHGVVTAHRQGEIDMQFVAPILNQQFRLTGNEINRGVWMIVQEK